MNINEMLYSDPKDIIAAIKERMVRDGISMDAAISSLAEDVLTQTKAEADAGMTHGEVIEVKHEESI